MNLVRTLLSVFLMMVLVVSILGWRWTTGDNLPPDFQIWGARLVLVISAVAALSGIGVLWAVKARKPN